MSRQKHLTKSQMVIWMLVDDPFWEIVSLLYGNKTNILPHSFIDAFKKRGRRLNVYSE